jgi:RNase P protein component
LRELARRLVPVLGVPGADHVFIARAREVETPSSELAAAMEKALDKARRRLEAA